MLGVVLNSISFITYIYFGVYILLVDNKTRENKIFFFICMIFALWSFSFIFIHAPFIVKSEKYYWLKIGYTAAYLYNPFLLLFALNLTDYYKPIKYKPFFLFILFILPVIYLYKHIADNAILDDLPFGFWYYTSHIYANLYNLSSLVIVIIGARYSQSNRIKLQTKIIVLGAIVAIVVTTLTDFYTGSKNIPTLTPVFLLIWIGSVWLSLVRHRFLAINQKLVNDIVLENIEEVIILFDTKHDIVTANNKCAMLMELSVDNIIGKSIFEFIDDTIFKKSLDKLKQLDEKHITLKINLKSPQLSELLLEARLQLIHDKYNDLLGYLFIGKELHGLERVRNIYGLSTREIDVIRHVLTGSTNKQIADQLKITERTVKNHLTSIYTKIGIDNKVQLLNAVIEG